MINLDYAVVCSSQLKYVSACSRFSPHISIEGCSPEQQAGRSA